MPRTYQPNEKITLSFGELGVIVSEYLTYLLASCNHQSERWAKLRGAVGIHQGYVNAQMRYYTHVRGFLKSHVVNTMRWNRSAHILSQSLEKVMKERATQRV